MGVDLKELEVHTGTPRIGLERIEKNLFRLRIATVGHVNIGLCNRIDTFVGINRGQPGLTEIGLNLAAAAGIDALTACSPENGTRTVTKFGQGRRRRRCPLPITTLVILVTTPAKQQRKNPTSPEQQGHVIRRWRLNFRRLGRCGGRYWCRRGFWHRRRRNHLGFRNRLGLLRHRLFGLRNCWCGNGCDRRLNRRRRRRNRLRRIRLHLSHTLALQLNQPLEFFDAPFEFGETSISLSQRLIARDEILLERLQPGDGLLSAGTTCTRRVLALGNLELVGRT